LENYPNKDLLAMYDKLKTARIFVQMMEKAVYQGMIKSSFHTYYGQEATNVGILSAVRDTDWLGYTHRGQILLYNRFGIEPFIAEIFGLRGGVARGSAFDFHMADYRPDGKRIVSMPGTLGSGSPTHTGFAWALKHRGEDSIIVSPQGDGACSEGYVYEAWNMAALFKLPILFVIDNNQWTMTVPLSRESANPNIAEKAGACGLPYQIVEDGTDLLKVREALDIGVGKARKFEPNVVEIKTLRWGPHFFGQPDDFREDNALIEEAKRDRDCVRRYEEYLTSKGLIDQTYIDRKTEEITAEIQRCQESAAKTGIPAYEDLYCKEVIYANPQTGGDL